MMELINTIKEKLKVDSSIEIVLENSNWRHHTLEGYIDDKITIRTDYARENGFDEIREKTIKHYLDSEDRFYTLFMVKIKRMLEFEDFYDYDFEPAFEAYEIELPEAVTNDWIKENIKLVEIHILEEKEGMCYLEFDFAVSWDEEHGMKALTHNDKFFEFAEGGYIWSLD